METWRFDWLEPKYDDRHACQFAVLDLVATFSFKSATSISFKLIRKLSEVHKDLGPREWTREVGVLVVHHPCEGHIKTHLDVQCPAEYHVFEQMQEFVHSVFEALAIPSDETFEALFVTHPDQAVCLVNATDRDGGSDRISTICRDV